MLSVSIGKVIDQQDAWSAKLVIASVYCTENNHISLTVYMMIQSNLLKRPPESGDHLSVITAC